MEEYFSDPQFIGHHPHCLRSIPVCRSLNLLRPLRLKPFGLLFALLVAATIAKAQSIEWTFPKPGMATKTINGVQFCDLGNEFLARLDTLGDNQMAIVVLRSDMNALIDNVNRAQPGSIPNKDQFMTAIAVEKAVISAQGEVSKYLGSGKYEGRDIYLYQARNGAIVGATLSNDKTFAMLMPYKEPATAPRPTPTPAQSTGSGSKLSANYDRFTDETTVETDLMRLWGTTYDHLEVSFGSVYKGAPPKKPAIGVIFKQIFKDTSVIEAKQIYVIADGERLTIDNVTKLLLKNALPGTSVYRHEFFVLLDFDTALKLAKSKKVELKIGYVETALQSAHQSALLGLLKRFE